MYHVHATDAVVLKSHPSGEADGLFELLTRDYGLVYAKATGIRLQKSKLRYSMQELFVSRVELVRGREYWRLVGARSDASLYATLSARGTLDTFVRLLSLVRRLVAGEEAAGGVYADVEDAAARLSDPGRDSRGVELVIAARMLERLGYFDRRPFPELFEEGDEASALARETELVAAINRAIKESHL